MSTRLSEIYLQMAKLGATPEMVALALDAYEAGMSRNVSQERLGTLAEKAVATQPSANAIRKKRWRIKKKLENKAAETAKNDPKVEAVPRNGSGNAVEQLPTVINTSFSKNGIEEGKGSGNAREDEQGFPELWAVFPKRAGNNPRKPALQSYLRALKKGATKAEICDGALRYAATCDVRSRFTKQLVTWLNQEGWKDEYHTHPNGGSAFAQASQSLHERIAERGFDFGQPGNGRPNDKTPPY